MTAIVLIFRLRGCGRGNGYVGARTVTSNLEVVAVAVKVHHCPPLSTTRNQGKQVGKRDRQTHSITFHLYHQSSPS